MLCRITSDLPRFARYYVKASSSFAVSLFLTLDKFKFAAIMILQKVRSISLGCWRKLQSLNKFARDCNIPSQFIYLFISRARSKLLKFPFFASLSRMYPSYRFNFSRAPHNVVHTITNTRIHAHVTPHPRLLSRIRNNIPRAGKF